MGQMYLGPAVDMADEDTSSHAEAVDEESKYEKLGYKWKLHTAWGQELLCDKAEEDNQGQKDRDSKRDLSIFTFIHDLQC